MGSNMLFVIFPTRKHVPILKTHVVVFSIVNVLAFFFCCKRVNTYVCVYVCVFMDT